MKIFAMVFLAALLIACTQPHRAAQALALSGFTNIKILGRANRLCGSDEDFGARFMADIDGRTVFGEVCHEQFGQDVVRVMKYNEEP